MASSTKDKLLSPQHIHQLIKNGHTIVLLGRKVLKLDSWLKYHPGGDKTILHMVGRDATDEFDA